MVTNLFIFILDIVENAYLNFQNYFQNSDPLKNESKTCIALIWLLTSVITNY